MRTADRGRSVTGAGTATRAAQVALVTCAALPDADADSRHVIEPLAARGISVRPAVWDDPRVDWASFDLAIVRSCWDYAGQRREFLAWAETVPRLMNPSTVLAWNTDKRYLEELAAADIPVIPTVWLEPGDAAVLPWDSAQRGEWVVKPAVSHSALDTGRYDTDDPEERRLAEGHVRRLREAGRTVLLQPYVSGVDAAGESSLVFIDGCFSHALRKPPVLGGPDTGADRRCGPNGGLDPRACRPAAAEVEVAERALAAVPGRGELLYARVDLVPGDDGTPLVMEVELTEPVLFLSLAPGAADRFAAAIAARTERAALRNASA